MIGSTIFLLRDISVDVTNGNLLPFANIIVIIGTFLLLSFTRLRPQFVPLFCFIVGVIVNYYHWK